MGECNGIYALGFVDTVHRKLFLARDPFGIKPLYYYKTARSFIFCSEIKPILELVNDSLDTENLAELLRLRYSPSPDTLFRNIKKVRPGHIIEVDLADPNLGLREYPFMRPVTTMSGISFEEARDHYGVLFEEAVQRQLMSDVEVGTLLSGGIDSALVSWFAQRQASYRMKSFTIGFTEQADADETADARETADIIGMDHYETRISFEDFLETIRKCVILVEEPLATTSIIPMYYLSELASRHVKVVLSGQGADESLGGYGRYQGELLRKIMPASIARALIPFARVARVRDEQILRGLRALAENDDLERFLSVYEVFDRNEIISLTGIRECRSHERLRYFFDLLGCAARKSSVERMMSIDLRMNLADDLLLYTDKVTMHHSIECRVPMLDTELVRFVESLPYQHRIRLGRGKIIHKSFAATVLPDRVIHRKKKGFLSPTKSWFKKGRLLREILLDPTSRFASFFNLTAVNEVLKAHENGFNRERHIFLLLGLYYWMAEYA
jgi:asparagine synthase (glutamine-hydrolysing)